MLEIRYVKLFFLIILFSHLPQISKPKHTTGSPDEI